LIARRIRTVALQIQPRAIPTFLFFANRVNGCAVFAILRRNQTSVVPRAKSVSLIPTLNHVDLLDEEEEKEEVALSFKSGDASS
jgi:hypothetical protein